MPWISDFINQPPSLQRLGWNSYLLSEASYAGGAATQREDPILGPRLARSKDPWPIKAASERCAPFRKDTPGSRASASPRNLLKFNSSSDVYLDHVVAFRATKCSMPTIRSLDKAFDQHIPVELVFLNSSARIQLPTYSFSMILLFAASSWKHTASNL